MKKQMKILKNEINKLNEDDIIFEYKNNMLIFVNTVIKFIK